MSEFALQSQCFIWHWNTYRDRRRTLFHVQNKARNAIEGSKFKAMGVVQGVSDFILLVRGRVLFIELKDVHGVQTPEQREFERQCVALGHGYKIIRNFTEFKNLIIKLYAEEEES